MVGKLRNLLLQKFTKYQQAVINRSGSGDSVKSGEQRDYMSKQQNVMAASMLNKRQKIATGPVNGGGISCQPSE